MSAPEETEQIGSGGRRPTYWDELEPGEELDGRYRVIRRLGSGGMGTVYEAEQIKLRRRVALKIMHPERAARRKSSHRFLREARAASSVVHPNVVDILDFGELEGGINYLVMELLQGLDLAGLLEQHGPLDWPRTKEILLQVLRGLKAAHTSKIIHRDIKPANIFLLGADDAQIRTDRIKVLDFGIARFEQAGDETQKLTGTAEMLGTVSYMSPEVALNKPATVQSDIYAVGILAYEMLTGSTPFQGDGPLQVMYAQIHEAPARPRNLNANISRAVEGTILRAMAKDPADRFQGTEEFEQALARLDDDGKSASWVLSDLVRGSGPPGSRRRPWAAVLLALLVVITAGGAWLWLNRESGAPPVARETRTPPERAASEAAVRAGTARVEARDRAASSPRRAEAPRAPDRSVEGAQGEAANDQSTGAGSTGSSSGGDTGVRSDATVRFDNRLSRAVKLYAIDDAGDEQFHADLRAGEIEQVAARIGQRWVVRGANNRMIRDEAIAQIEQVVVLEPRRKSPAATPSRPPGGARPDPAPPKRSTTPTPSPERRPSTRSTAERAAKKCGKHHGTLFQSISVDFKIGADGTVASASVREPLRGTHVGSCVAKAIARLHFSQDQAGQSKTWTLSF